ncbi:sporulation protein YqfD [Bacillus sp. T33-2]|uniref:sporulation protein YqfD n=1 Tax=Bacillus sp. T33-2 TaxID=2054168 RepID=UPI000C7826A6|nr:sporulation protein YqfD [Bacillus sp. T33-2]PLR93822.1 sporulation protein YqfD [Bacillus sp. T33-2]
MKNRWIEYYSGILKVKVSGKGIERFLNQLIRMDIHVWNVKRHGTEAVVFSMRLKDAKKLRGPARSYGCKIRFLERSGGPFFLYRLWTNSGFVLGAIVFLFVVIFLSNMVWGIQIKGASPATEHLIRKELDKMGIKTGTLQFFIGSPESIQRELTDNIEALTWVGVDLKGTTYHFQVVEKDEPEKPEMLSPQNLVADREAVIHSMFVEKGEPVVSINDYVKEGDLLVSGLIGKEEEKQAVAAKGEVHGITWYETQVEIPLKSKFQVFNGKEKRKFFIKLGKLAIPVWGFGKPEFKQYETASHDHTIKLFKWELPLAFRKETIRESEQVTRVYTRLEAISSAKEIARKDIKSRLSEDAKIKEEKILHQSIENDKVKVIISFDIIQDIAKEQPIIQGD